MTKICGIDLGTNSIGLSVRDDERGKSIIDQLEFFNSVIFESGVGHNKSGEYSYAADRTKHRSTRRLYQARKYRKWSTLALLIENGYCPLAIEDLDKWRVYDKAKGLHREYPVDAERFEQWIRLDFNGDGIADYSSPYQLRAELMKRQFDFNNEIERFKLGRAIYHIAQRRGFKSSKGETIAEQEAAEIFDNDSLDMTNELKKSEEKKSKDLVAYMTEKGLPTVGCAFAHLEKEGIRVRNSIYQAVRSQYKDELFQIFSFQNGIDENSEFCKRVLSEKKHEGTVFYKRPLRSQKGAVGNCTMEPDKPRCQTTHPDFEDFRAWCFINNIKYRVTAHDEWQSIDLKLKEDMFNEKFIRTKTSFEFKELREWLEKKLGIKLSQKDKTINYKDNTNVSGCPVSARLKNLLGEDWRHFRLSSGQERVNVKRGEAHMISYDVYDIWHICATADEAENVEIIARERFGFDDKQVKKIVSIWGNMQQGYANLSLKAIRNINRFLHLGFIYSDAVMLAKVPEIIGEELWNENEELILSSINGITDANRELKEIYQIVNTLIANYKILDLEGKFGNHDTTYCLDEDDKRQAKECIVETLSAKRWNDLSDDKQHEIEQKVINLYQDFFASNQRSYYKVPKLGDSLKQFLYDNFDFLQCEYDTPSPQCKCNSCKRLNKLYHPSQIEFYQPAKYQIVDCKSGKLSKKLLDTPTIGAIKNPVVMRALHTLRQQINNLIKEEIIDEDTRIVVETARDLNDANMRWAIEQYQKEREKENKEIEKIILENYPSRNISDDDIDKARLLLEQYDLIEINEIVNEKGSKEEKTKFERFVKDVTKYKLWLEQGGRCIYTGKIINITNLFDDNAVDFEHTIPRSISFDNSLANLTICDAKFNRSIKKNQIPSQLTNHAEILVRIKPWIDKIEKLKANVEFWKNKAKRAADKDHKDTAIRQRHIWQMELDYWQQKVRTFTINIDELNLGFRNNQLVDTRIITKYAFHYLKTVFDRVDVQKGSATAEFRKMLGIQSLDEKKSRAKHSHHAIDATVLTLIPVAAKREKMMKLFYEIQEAEQLHVDCSRLRQELEHEIASCHFGDVKSVTDFIENNILVNHIAHDQALTPAKRQLRRRGKPVIGENGQPIWLTGDCIRGRLHEDTFLGAICEPVRDIEGRPICKNGVFDYETDKKGDVTLKMVLKINIDAFKSEKDLEKIIDPYVKRSILEVIKRRQAEGLSFDSAIKQPIWLLDKDGNEIKTDKNGRILSPIRHVRCKVAAGRGFLTKEKALTIKNQTYKSVHEYKSHIYAKNDTNYLCLLYEGINKGKLERVFKFINLFEAASLGITSSDDIKNEPYYSSMNEGKKNYQLRAVIKTGTKVLMWNETPDELAELDKSMLSFRLFEVYKFNFKGANCIYLQNHIEARPDSEIDIEDTKYEIGKYQPRLTLVANNFNCLIEGCDFEIDKIGNIKFL